MEYVSPTAKETKNGQFNQYDSGFMKHDLDFDAQNILDSNRDKLINNHYDISCLSEYCIKFDKLSQKLRKVNKNNNENNEKDTDDSQENEIKKLSFDCNFESGNIGEIIYFKDNEYDIKIRGDTNNERHSIWFYFRVIGGIKGDKIICHITNYSKNKSLYSEGFTPLIRSKKRPIWVRLPEYNVNWFKCNRHRKNCFTFSFVFDKNDDEYFFAYSYPYTYVM